MSRSSEPVRMGLIGVGRIAQVAHLPAMAKAEGVRLVAVSDASERLAGAVGARYDVPWFTDSRALLEQDLDAVLIATPDRTHLPLGLQALEADRHVLMEKPLASTSAEARILADAAASRGLRLQTGSMKRHDPGLEYAHANIGRIGRILSMHAWYRVMAASRAGIQRTVFPPFVVDEAVSAAEARFKADPGSYRLATHGAHVFDALRYLAGDLAWLSCRSVSVGPDHSWHGTCGIEGSGGLASFEITVNVHSEWSEGMEIFGELGHVSIRSPYAFLKVGSSVELYVETDRMAYIPHFEDTDAYKRQLESFARAVREDRETDPSPDDGVQALRLIEAAAMSAAEGGRDVVLT